MLAVLIASPAGAAQLAFDNASQPAYSDGWQTGDNGGSGFGPWQITLNGGIVGVGTSTANGDAKLPTGDIDSAGGLAWSMSSARVVGRPVAVRPLVGALAVGQKLSFEVDGLDAGANSDGFVVLVGNAADVRWGLTIHSLATHAGTDTSGYTLVAERTPEGMHVDFTLTGPDTYAASVRVLDGSDPVLLSGTLDGAAGPAIDQLSFAVGPSFAPVDAFYANNIAVTPEPGTGLLALVGVGMLAVCPRRSQRVRYKTYKTSITPVHP